jgi:hypothetical protein
VTKAPFFGNPNPHLSYESQYSNFSIMLREGFLTPEEYQKKVEVLNNLFNQTVPARFFSIYSKNQIFQAVLVFATELSRIFYRNCQKITRAPHCLNQVI